VAARHPLGFFKIQDGRQDGRNSEPKSADYHNFHSKCSRMVMLVLRNMFSKGKESNCYVIIVFGDPLDERIQDGRQNI